MAYEALPSDAVAESTMLLKLAHVYDERRADQLSKLVVSRWQAQEFLEAIQRAYRGKQVWTGVMHVQLAMCEVFCAGLRAHRFWMPGQCRSWSRWAEFVDAAAHSGVGEQSEEYWLGRLESCVEARRLIELAQRVAERAYRLDVPGARASVAREASRLNALPLAQVEGSPTLEDILAEA